MRVVKRNGQSEEFDPNKILTRIKSSAQGLKVDADQVAIKVISGFSDGISTTELDDFASETAASLTATHPDYSSLAARIAVSSLHKETPGRFSDAIEFLWNSTSLLSREFYNNVMEHCDEIDAKIVHDRDFTYDYFGFRTLKRAYLLKSGTKVVERPQYMIMRVALGVWGDNLEEAFKTYDLMSTKFFTHATPTLFNAGSRRPQLSSCFLLGNKGDSIKGITGTFADTAQISALAGGIGLHIHDLRATGSLIKGSGGTSNGILPYLKSMNEWSKYWDQGGGKRKGSFAIYLEPWHKDIFTLIDIRKNHGVESERARELFPALWIPDLFMNRVETDGNWTLFCPNEVLNYDGTKLQNLYGEEFNKKYEELEQVSELGNTIKARELWNAILNAQIETGTPYMAYKDAINIKSNQKNIGTIKSSNLCIEIVEYSDENEQAVCNLGSLALPMFVKKVDKLNGSYYEVDHDKLYEVTYQLAKNLNRVIDVNYYPTPETELSNKKHRPIGIGVQGLADMFALLKIPFDSLEAEQVNKDVFETIYYAFLSSSCDTASKDGPYETFKGSPASEGILQFDMWNIEPSTRWDWKGLKHAISLWGLRNSLGIALMPTASTGQILGNNEAFEAFNSNLSTRRTLAGEFVIINKHLVRDLEEIGLWNVGMKNKLVATYGSVQTISEIPREIRDRYKTVYEISQKVILNMCADRGAFVDQTQSMNLFIDNPNIGKLTSMHFYGWKKGLKTGMYYLRSKPAANAIQFTVDKTEEAQQAAIACSIDNPEACESCSG